MERETCPCSFPVFRNIFGNRGGREGEKSVNNTNHSKGERECIIPLPKSENERGMKKTTFPKFWHRSGTKKSTPEIQEREGNEKNPFPKFGKGKGMKEVHSRNSGRESEASILGNDREREFPLTPAKDSFLPIRNPTTAL